MLLVGESSKYREYIDNLLILNLCFTFGLKQKQKQHSAASLKNAMKNPIMKIHVRARKGKFNLLECR